MELSPINPAPSPDLGLMGFSLKIREVWAFQGRGKFGEVYERYGRGKFGENSAQGYERYDTPKFGESLTMSTMLCILVIIPAGQGN